MDRLGSENSGPQACSCPCARDPTPPLPRRQAEADWTRPTWWQRALAVATVASGLMLGLNALVQALNVLAAWWGYPR